MGEQIVEKIIGAWYVIDENGRLFAADIYEGNYYKLIEHNIQKTLPLASKDYDRVVSQYKECLEKNIHINTAYEMNQRACLNFAVPEITADPDAAEKEWYIRTHPQVVHVPEKQKKKKSLFGGKKKNISIKCLECGHINATEQKFCGECGAKLISAEDEFNNQATDSDNPAENNDVELDIENETVEEVEEIATPVKAKEAKSEAVEDKPSDVNKGKKEKKEKKPKVKKEKVETTEVKVNEPKTGGKGRIAIIVICVLGGVFALVAAVILLLSATGSSKEYDYDKYESSTEPVYEEVVETVPTEYVAIKVINTVNANEQIKEEDIEGVRLSAEQYEKYSNISTYVDSDGQVKSQNIILWDNKADVVGKYATRDIPVGSIIYNTSVTTEHVVADKTFVDVEVDGEVNTIEVNTDTLPGNTRIQIIAVVQTDSEDPQQILLSEMTLQDRS